MPAWITDEDFLEVRAADGQDDFVALQQLTIACDCAIDKIPAIEQALESCR